MQLFCRLAAIGIAASLIAVAQDAKSADPKERAKYARDLGRSGSEAITQLTPLLSDQDRDVRLEALKSIVSIGTQRSIDALVAATRDNDPEIQIRATDGIVNFYLPGYVQSGALQRFGAAVRGRFDREDGRTIDPYVIVRDDAITAIGRLVRGGNGMEVRANAARAAGILRGRAAAPDLIAALSTKDDDVIFESLIALQKIQDQTAGPKVIFLLRDLQERVQIAAIETVGLLRTKEAVPELQKVYKQGRSDKVRQSALGALAMLPDPSSRTIYQAAFADKSEGIRAAAAEGYARLKNPEDLAMLRKAFEEEKKAQARIAEAFALVSLGQLETTEFAPLTTVVNGLNSKRYGNTARAYLTELSRTAPVREALYTYLRQGTRDEKIGLAHVLSVSGDRATVPHLETLSKDADVEVAQEGVRAVRNLQARLQ